MTKTVPEMLAELAELYKQRNVLYDNNYKMFGYAMIAMFPEGVTLKSVDDFNRFGIFVQIISKATRYGQQFNNGGHADSLDDVAVYSQMLQELDNVKRREPPGIKGELGPSGAVDGATYEG